MKIRILRNVLAEIEKPRLDETWDHYFIRWDELNVESINVVGKFAHLITVDGDVIQHLPIDTFEVIK